MKPGKQYRNEPGANLSYMIVSVFFFFFWQVSALLLIMPLKNKYSVGSIWVRPGKQTFSKTWSDRENPTGSCLKVNLDPLLLPSKLNKVWTFCIWNCEWHENINLKVYRQKKWVLPCFCPKVENRDWPLNEHENSKYSSHVGICCKMMYHKGQ